VTRSGIRGETSTGSRNSQPKRCKAVTTGGIEARLGPPVVIGVESRPPNAQSLARAHQGTARFRRDKRLVAKLDSLLGAVDADDEGEA
jgi:hypothetical protein